MVTCEKCGKDVPTNNNAVFLDAIRQGSDINDTWVRSTLTLHYGGRHFLPVDGCQGSPSRAQYIEGQPKDSRGAYPYQSRLEKTYRDAYEKLKQIT